MVYQYRCYEQETNHLLLVTLNLNFLEGKVLNLLVFVQYPRDYCLNLKYATHRLIVVIKLKNIIITTKFYLKKVKDFF